MTKPFLGLLTLILACSLRPAPGAVASTVAKPTIQVWAPSSNSVFTAGRNVDIWIEASGSSTDLQYLSAYAGSLLLGSIEGSSLHLTWSNAPVGVYALTAIGLGMDGSYAKSATVPIQIVAPPPNDDWQNAIPIEGTNVLVSGTLLGATAQEFERFDHYSLPRNSVWWRWTAPISGKFTIVSDGTYFQTDVALTTNPGALIREEILGVFRTNSHHGALTFQAEQGITYWIATFEDGAAYRPDPEFPPSGTVTLQLRLATPPPYDNFDHPMVLSGGYVLTNFTTIEAVQSPADEWGSGPAVWFSWQAPSNGLYRLSGLVRAYYGGIFLWTGSSLTNLTPVWSKPTDQAGSTQIVFEAAAETIYRWVFQTAFETGDYQLLIEPFPRQTNDDSADRIPVSGSNVLFTGDFIGATPDPGQPAWLRDTLWWSWTAPSSGRCRLTNEPGSYCGVAVFVGSVISNLLAIFPTNEFAPASVDFDAQAGTTYEIALSSPFYGSARLVYVAIPSNDDFANRQLLFGSDVNISTTVAESTIEVGEPYAHEGNWSTWYEWNAPTTGPFSVTAESPYTLLAVYTGSSVSNLALVQPQAGRNPDRNSDGTAAVHFDALEGVSYQIQLLGGPSSNFILRIAPRPLNDDFADRIDISGINVGTGTGAGATGAPFGTEYCNNSLWWRWTAPSNGSYTLSTAGSDPYYRVSVRHDQYYAPDITSAFWSSNGPSAAHFTATNGEAFSFMFCGRSNAVIRINERHAPANDDFARRLPITSIPTNVSGTLFGASGESFEFGQIIRPHSVWYTWTPPSNGLYAASTEGSDLRLHIDIYTGSEPGTLHDALLFTRISPSGALSALFRGVAGTPVQLRVSQEDSSEGNFVLHLQPAHSADDGCSESISLADLSFSIIGTNLPEAGADGGPSALCWTWTAPKTGIYKISVTGSNEVTLVKQEAGFWQTIQRTDSILWFEVTQGTSYRFVVDAIHRNGGRFTLDLLHEPAPPNDDFDHRLKIVHSIEHLSGTTSGASDEPGEPPPESESSASVWFSWQAPSSRTVRIRLPDTDGLAPAIAIFTGSSLSELQLVEFGWGVVPFGSLVIFRADAGVEYQIAIRTQPVPGAYELAFEAPSDFEIVVGDGPDIQLRLEGPVGVMSVLEASVDLVQWLPISTNLNMTGTMWLSDPDARLFDRRFYRIR